MREQNNGTHRPPFPRREMGQRELLFISPEHSSPLTVVRRQVGLLLGPPRPSRLILTTRG